MNLTNKQPIFSFNFKGNLGNNQINLSQLNQQYVYQFVQIKGIISKISPVKLNLDVAGFCKGISNQGSYQQFYNQYDLFTSDFDKIKRTNHIQQVDNEGVKVNLQYGHSIYKFQSYLILQDLPENIQQGCLPKSLQVYIDQDQINQFKPGDRVSIRGVIKLVQNLELSYFNLNLVLISTEIENLNINYNLSSNDIDDIQKFFQSQQNPLDTLVEMVCPNIQNYNEIKKGILVQQVQGNQIQQQQTRIRGDINIMIIGDPGTAKSQLLRYVHNLSPISILTTGKSSSSAGLTASVVYDNWSNQKQLQAGAAVLSDGGVLCIDEFDKMDDQDRVAIHEALEQQVVSISKAGINTQLNCRCAYFAIANPKYGFYNFEQSPSQNINMQETILSRFDLIFILIDLKDSKQDYIISSKVLQNHQESKIITIFSNQESNNESNNKIIFLQKIIQYCKKLKPQLLDSSLQIIVQYYAQIRQNFQRNNISTIVSIRTLESLIRISVAFAKLRLSQTVDNEDVQNAIDLFEYSLNQQNQSVESNQSKNQNQKSQKIQMSQIKQENANHYLEDNKVLQQVIYQKLTDMQFMNQKLYQHLEQKIEMQKLLQILDQFQLEGKIMLDNQQVNQSKYIYLI